MENVWRLGRVGGSVGSHGTWVEHSNCKLIVRAYFCLAVLSEVEEFRICVIQKALASAMLGGVVLPSHFTREITTRLNVNVGAGRLIDIDTYLTCSHRFHFNLLIMSDFEDDMDVDGAPSHDQSIQFNSDNAAVKGKRIAADLPVEAEDNLPW
jgi:hypothetical protein